jgi:hypothetical protein
LKELGEALKIIFAKVAGFFDIFDLSFFISGIASFSAIATFLQLKNVPIATNLESKVGIFIAAIASYILGLVSFALGRFLQNSILLRTKKESSAKEGSDKRLTMSEKRIKISEVRFIDTLKAHGLDKQYGFNKYLQKTNENSESIDRYDPARIQALYTRLWAEVRHSESVSTSLELLNSYWVKAATFDGLAVSLLLWFLVFLSSALGLVDMKKINPYISAVFATFFLIAAASCFNEARRYREYQAKELVATIASGIKLK